MSLPGLHRYIVWCPDLGETRADGEADVRHDEGAAVFAWCKRQLKGGLRGEFTVLVAQAGDEAEREFNTKLCETGG